VVTEFWFSSTRTALSAVLICQVLGGKMGRRLNPELSRIPHVLMKELPGSQISLSRWGLFFDEVLLHPAQYGIRTLAPRVQEGRYSTKIQLGVLVSPETYFYYHEGHPSTAVPKIVGDKVYEEMLSTHTL
jgi:cholinesterase